MFEKIHTLRGRGYKTRLTHPHDEIWDRRLGVRTFGYHPGSGRQGDVDWQLHYEPVPYSDIFHLLKMVGLAENDVFTDLGCGLGRAVFAASWMGAKRSLGLEIVPQLHAKAVENLNRSRLTNRDIEFWCENAINYRDKETTILFMYHPFGEEVLHQVLRNLEEERIARSRGTLRIIYLNPVFDTVLKKTHWLRPLGRVETSNRWYYPTQRYEATLWQSL